MKRAAPADDNDQSSVCSRDSNAPSDSLTSVCTRLLTTEARSGNECSTAVRQNARKQCKDRRRKSHQSSSITVISTELSSSEQSPSARWGHVTCLISDSDVVLIGGQGERNILNRDAVWLLNASDRKWTVPDVVTTSMKPEARTGHSVVYSSLVRCLYVFGGSKNKKWFNDVYMVDTDNWTWQCVRTSGSAPARAYHSCTLYGHEMWIFGGVYPRPDPVPDSCSNDIYVFNLFEEMWYRPLVIGPKPSPRSGHSATLFDDVLVVFGGWDAPVCYNDLYILDMRLVEWSKPEVNGTIPSPRSWHAACALSGRRLLVHGGYNGNVVLADSYTFDVGKLTWRLLDMEPSIPARTGHTAVPIPLRHKTRDHDTVLLFGGGDNEGKFFSELFSLSVPTDLESDSPDVDT